ncbi:hypothetical protein [Microcoleus sp. FACHB-68]|uniref:hypothetical protein n=1 Tax=Microcoleus sp. FACHB-68 TaxID=2692826 RepID=UPI001683460E|nr:hypothetical protein [Microcoleus sp. FACHB-68]MBD1937665.1 hypothetical protein [Microcoleus sp. FACHB-68]
MKITHYSQGRKFLRPLALLLTALLALPLFTACSSQTAAPPPPVDDTRGGSVPYNSPQQPRARQGLSNTQKVAILAGAAALYYLYNQQKNAKGQGPQGQYYLSKNGRVYYRDAQNRPHWVTPPQGGIQVPEAEAQQYRDFQGYNNQPTGRDLTGLGSAPVPAQQY